MTSSEASGSSEVTTVSGIPLKVSYGPNDVPETAAQAAAVLPGEAPYLRGAHAQGYRSKPWRIFQLSGFGNPEDEAERIRYLLSKGGTGFIMEHDRMTGDHLYDVDHPEVVARREDVGISGAVILSARDFELALTGIDQSKYFAHPGGGVSQHAAFALAGYWTVAERRGLELHKLNGTGQADFFLTYIGCPPLTQIPPAAALRVNCDIVEYAAKVAPKWTPISMAAYNGADSGLNAYQELAALFACCVSHLDEIVARGNVPVEQVAYALGGVSFRVAMDFFEDICKLRVARKMWHRLLTTRYGITDPRALSLRIHIVTAGSAMTYQEPINNIVRGTVMGMAAVLGGVQSIGVSAYDEALSVPSEQAHRQSLRVQQILMHETNIPAVVDPLGGSYFIESLSAELEERAWAEFDRILDNGGFIQSLEDGSLHRMAGENAVAFQDSITSGDRKIVGVNLGDSDGDPFGIDGFEGSLDAFERGMARLKDLRASRDGRHVSRALDRLANTMRSGGNVMSGVMDAVRADASIGEVGDVYREVFGSWKFPVDF
ncbi:MULTISPECIES: acyl-CoA mutase large subunit family protein [unclassified Nocardioides]|uniref:acyl-CoA mutase large subunit family protein n=1 Tax=unclassified Nocardioides TaxID=2615069 RepID=UPI0000570029|nr:MULTISPECIES: acyl-CoA mutase large subunit family protein [unclassified Nocardioides]ABL80323.1 methylmalonyl-CoA mutase, large subunit [Nocardioides sp. JS614]